MSKAEKAAQPGPRGPEESPPMLTLLIQQSDGGRTVHEFRSFPITIGRARANDLVLDDFNASRVHAEIDYREGKFRLRDCQSLNGVRLNDHLIMDANLLTGDRVRIGDSEIRVLARGDEEAGGLDLPELAVGPAGTGGLLEIIHAFSMDQMLASPDPLAGLQGGADGGEARQRLAKLDQAYHTLLLLMNMVSGLGTSAHPEQLCEQFTTALQSAFPLMENVAVIRTTDKDEGTDPGSPGFELLHAHGETGQFEQTRSSRTILRRVLREMHAVHAVDASKDPRFSESDSVRRRGIRSMMCAPMIMRGEVRGAIYVENLSHPYCFTHFDLNLLTVFAFHLAASLELCWMARKQEDAFEQVVDSLRDSGESESDLLVQVYQSEKKFRALFEQSALGAAVIDLADGDIQEVNDGLIHLLGFNRRRLESMRLRDLVADDETARVEEWCAFIRSRGQGSCRMVLRTARTGSIIVLLNCRALRIDERQVMVAFFVDVTAKERMEQETQMQLRRVTVLAEYSRELMALREPEEVFQLLFEKVSTVIPLDTLDLAIQPFPAASLQRVFAAKRKGEDQFELLSEPEIVPGENRFVQETMLGGKPLLRQGSGGPWTDDAVTPMASDPFRFPDGAFLPSSVFVPMSLGERVDGVLCVQSERFRAYEPPHIELLAALAAQTGLGLSNAHAFRSIRDQQENLRQLSLQIMTAQETERGRISRELHDGVGQQLTGMKYVLESIRTAAKQGDAEKLHERVAEANELAKQLMEDLRAISLDLRPTMLDDLGLEPTLQWLCDQFARRHGVETVVKCRLGRKPLDPDIATATYRIAQEALGNVAKHAKARRVEITLRHEKDGWLHLDIRDDGMGFQATELQKFRASRGCSGVLNMKERTHFLGGHFHLETAPGAGTNLHVRIPTGEG